MVRLYIAKLVTSLPAPSVLRNIIVIFTVKIIAIIAFVLTAEVMVITIIITITCTLQVSFNGTKT